MLEVGFVDPTFLTDLTRRTGPHKEEFRNFLVANGARFHTNLFKKSTHLIVASPASPHSQNNSKKLSDARQVKNLKIVWEGWAHEVAEQGGERKSRAELWSWKAGGMEPTEEELTEDPGRDAFAEQDTTHAAPEVARESEEREERMVMPSRKAKARGAKQDLLAVKLLLEGYSGSQPTRARADHEDDLNLPQQLEATKEKDVGMRMELVEDTDRLGAKGKSVIKALSNSRSTSFHASIPARPKTLSTRDDGLCAADDSAFFEDSALVPKTVEKEEEDAEEEEDPQLFAGKSFALMAMVGDVGKTVGSAVKKLGGKVSFDEGEDEADWVCVTHLK